MNGKLRKITAVILVAVCTACCLAPAASAASATSSPNPIVYVMGRGTQIYDKNGNQISPVSRTISDALDDNRAAIATSLMYGISSGSWTRYCNTLVETIEPVYADLVLNQDGEIDDGSYARESAEPKVKTSKFTLSDYVFYYDMRIDPIESAKKLNTYINKVLAATGKSKVNLIGRCLGASIVAAYLTKYPGNAAKYIDNCVFYAAACNGVATVGCAFSGKIYVDSDLLTSYTSATDFNETISALVTLARQAQLLGVGTELVNSIYNTVADQVLPELVLKTYGTMPGYWSMVGDEDYEDAKNFVFYGDNRTLYSGLIEKIDNYHYNVQQQLPSTLLSLKSQGVKISVISKYNVALAPIFERSAVQADDTVELSTMSFGATSNNIGSALDRDYLLDVSNMGLSDYISKDSLIDASTGLFPDTTWYIKNLRHDLFPTCINSLMYEIFSSSGQMTVRSSSSYPRFMRYVDDNTLSAVTGMDPADTSSGSEQSNSIVTILSNFVKYFLSVFRVILTLFSSVILGRG